MKELVCNLHIHTTYSDGTGSYNDILEAAAVAGMDVVITTDHNIWVQGVEGYYQKNGKRILLLTGEEVHDPSRDPQKNHLLVFGAEGEVAPYACDQQLLIDTVKKMGGFCYIAHPDEYPLPLFHEPAISWENWGVNGYTGFELWNGMSEFKTVSQSFFGMVTNAFFPELVAHHPLPQTLQRWDALLKMGNKLSVVGGTDSHALHIKLGPFTKVLFPYTFHFSTINNHLLIDGGLSGEFQTDKKLVLDALREGSHFVGYDLPASTKGFSFRIDGEEGSAGLGGSLAFHRSAIAHIKLPFPVETLLIRDGEVVYKSENTDTISYPVTKPGAYRVECYIRFLGRKRGWIFSNPIYLTKVG
jgi:hypothetical protein